MGWRSRVLLGRVRDQGTVVATVTLVTLAATTLLGTFAFLLHVTGDDAVDAALQRAPESDVALDVTLRVRQSDTQTVLDAATSALDRTLGDVPYSTSTWLEGRLWSLPRPDGPLLAPLAYAASTPLVPDRAELLSGAWPTTARDDAGRLAVNVTDAAAQRYGWSVGTEVPVRTANSRTPDTWVVVGTHRLTGPTAVWTPDLLDGRGHEEAFPVPGTMGGSTTDAWGPFVVAPDALLGEGVTDVAHLTLRPDLAGVPAGAVAALRERLDSAQVELAAALREVDVSGTVRTSLDTTIDSAWRALAVTRIGVVVVGLLLVVLATTVMLRAAELLAGRRAAEGSLLAARGGSPAQLRSLAVLEAAAVAVTAAAASPFAARVAFARLAQVGGLEDAGLTAHPGVPTSVVVACASVAVVLAVALVVPSWHVQGSSEAGAHAGMVRTGVDVALLVLGGVALWQLLDYGAPLTQGPGGARLDPVLVAGPAAVVLAAAVLALRLVGPVARGADALARRGRSLVAPLAAWQVARRPQAATGTTLVVVLAVATATFAHAVSATWRTSQTEQVDVALGTDVRLDGLRDEPLTVSADLHGTLDGAVGVAVQPVVTRPVAVGRSSDAYEAVAAVDSHLVAVDTTDADDLRGRTDVPWSDLLADLAPTPDGPGAADGRPLSGVALPGTPQWLVGTLTTDAGPPASGEVRASLVVEDATGARAWLEVPTAVLSTSSELVVEVPRSLGELRLVAVTATLTLDTTPDWVLGATTPAARIGRVGLALHDLRVVDRSVGAKDRADALAASAASPVVDLSGGTWDGRATSLYGLRPVRTGGDAPVPDPATLPPDALVVTGELDMLVVADTYGRLTAHSWAHEDAVPAVVTSALAERADLGVGSTFGLPVGGAWVEVVTTEVVPYLPAVPRGPGLLVDRTALGRALVQEAAADPLADTWWLTAPDDVAPDLAARAVEATAATTTVRVAERTAAVEGPLHVTVPAALSLVTLATAVLLLVGLGSAAAGAVRARRLELARLQALGASRRSLVGGLVGEHALLVLLGTAAGLAVGRGVAAVVAPVLTVSSDGRRPVPEPLLVWQGGEVSVITLGLVLATCATVAVLAAVLVRRASGALLRLGDDR